MKERVDKIVYEEENKKWNIKKYFIFTILTIGIPFLIIASIFYVNNLFNNNQNINPLNLSNSQFSCLDGKLIFMGVEWCSHCKNQKEYFGTRLTNQSYIDCDIHKSTCDDYGVNGYPTFIVYNDIGNFTRINSEVKIDKIINYSGCNK